MHSTGAWNPGEAGDRVRLVTIADEHSLLSPGDEGVIALVDVTETRHVRWDDGSLLGLVPGVDAWTVLPAPSTVEP